MKKIGLWFLAFVLVLSMCACSSKSDVATVQPDEQGNTSVEAEESTQPTESTKEQENSGELVGKWKADIDLTDYLIDTVGDSFPYDLTQMESTLVMPMTLQFNSDNTAVLEINKTAYAESAKDYIAALIDFACEEMYKQMEDENGLSREEVDEIFKQAYDSDIKSYMQDAFGEIDFTDMIGDEDLKTECHYLMDGDALYLFTEEELPDEAEPLHFEIENGTLTLVDTEDAYENLVGIDIFPMTCTKVD